MNSVLCKMLVYYKWQRAPMCKSVSVWCLRPHCPDIGRCVYMPLRVRTCMHVRLNNCAYENTCLNVLWVYKNMKMYAYQYICMHMITYRYNCIFIAFLDFCFPFILMYFNFPVPTRRPFSSSSEIIFPQAVSSLFFFFSLFSSLCSLSPSLFHLFCLLVRSLTCSLLCVFAWAKLDQTCMKWYEQTFMRISFVCNIR